MLMLVRSVWLMGREGSRGGEAQGRENSQEVDLMVPGRTDRLNEGGAHGMETVRNPVSLVSPKPSASKPCPFVLPCLCLGCALAHGNTTFLSPFPLTGSYLVPWDIQVPPPSSKKSMVKGTE